MSFATVAFSGIQETVAEGTQGFALDEFCGLSIIINYFLKSLSGFWGFGEQNLTDASL